MNSRERIFAALRHQVPDRIPRFEVWIDGLYQELGVSDPYKAYAELGQDARINAQPITTGKQCLEKRRG